MARASLAAEVKELGEKLAAGTNKSDEELATLKDSETRSAELEKSLESSEEKSGALKSQLAEQHELVRLLQVGNERFRNRESRILTA